MSSISDARTSRIFVGFGRQALQGNATHFDGPVPVDAVANDLFGWTCEPSPLFATVNGKPVHIPSHVANLRSDNAGFLGITGATYAVHQYATSLVDNVRAILGDGIGINAAGYNRNGAVGWVSVSLAASNVTAEGIEFMPQLFAIGSHDGSLASEYKRGVLNLVCNNQMGSLLRASSNVAENGTLSVSGKVRVKHTRNSVLRITNAREALGILAETADTFAETVRDLCQTEITPADWDAIVDELCGPVPSEAGQSKTIAEGKRDELNGLYRSDPRCSPWTGTAYGAVQTFNTWSHHLRTVRGAHRDDRNILATLNGDWDRHDNATHAAVRRVLVRRGA